MRKFTTKEIARITDVDVETVRRWIRSGELKATQLSKKGGNIVNEQDLYEFVSARPKYFGLYMVAICMLDNDLRIKKLNRELAMLSYERIELYGRIEEIDKRMDEIRTMLEEP